MLQNHKFQFLILTLFLIIPFEILSLMSIHFPWYVGLFLFVLVGGIFGRNVFLSGIKSLFKLNFADINLLMTIAIFGAVYLQEFPEAAVIVVLFALGETLEDYGIEKSKSALQNLVNKIPKTALIKGTESKIPIEEIKVGDILIIKPGDQIACDAKVVLGNSLVDEATITGEPLPQNKSVEDLIFAGTVNGNGYLEAEVLKESNDSALSKIIKLTFESAEKKSKSQKFIEIFSSYYTPLVTLGAILIVIIPVFIFQQPFNLWFQQALTLLIISCPCALVISTPISIFSAIGNATQRGILIKGGKSIEDIGKIKAIAFDKTRTLTQGTPVVSDIIAFDGFTEEEVIACAAGMEAFSEHPVAISILNKAKEMGLDIHKFEDFKAILGKGLQGECIVCHDKHHCLGNKKFISEEHTIQESILREIDRLEAQGKTAIVMADTNSIKGIIGISDEIRKESKAILKEIVDLNIRPIILTGDNKSSANYIGNLLNIDEIKFELLPEDKSKEVEKLIYKYKYVAMVGDGINDAPALAKSTVGIAMGAIGSDVAIENADIALLNDNLNNIPFLIKLSKKCINTIKLNISIAVITKLLVLVLALLGISNLTFAIIADVGVTILVILNSLRLYSYK